MLSQPSNHQLELVIGAVVLQENSITLQITKQYKQMEVITQQFNFPNCIEVGWYTHQSSRNRDSSPHATSLPSSTLRSLCYFAQARRAALWKSLSSGTLNPESTKLTKNGRQYDHQAINVANLALSSRFRQVPIGSPL
ncbi:hypothetical protein TNCV_4217821 [Trichonephila clavipes]|nr:hypothetical protein TNCV_4217821 [Trichonephila clavipes]